MGKKVELRKRRTHSAQSEMARRVSMMKGMASGMVVFWHLCKPVPLLLRTAVARQKSIRFEELFMARGATVTDSRDIGKCFGEK
jgi:hypothetical protein